MPVRCSDKSEVFGYIIKHKKHYWMQRIIEGLDISIKRYSSLAGYPPYNIGERVTNSCMITAIGRANGIALLEVPTTKTQLKESRKGRYDIYAGMPVKRVGFRHVSIETKQVYMSHKSRVSSFARALQKSWEDACRVRDIQRNDESGDTFGCTYYCLKLAAQRHPTRADINRSIMSMISTVRELPEADIVSWHFPRRYRLYKSPDNSGSRTKFYWPGIIVAMRKAPYRSPDRT